MKTYIFTGEVTVSCYTKVEANSLEEALEIAEERADNIDKAQWKDRRENEMWLSDGYDGTVQNIHHNE